MADGRLTSGPGISGASGSTSTAVNADEGRLVQVVSNLLTTPLVYEPRSPVRVGHPSPAARAIRNNPAPTRKPRHSRDALTGRSETFDGDRCTHDSHRGEVHDPDDQEHRHQTGTAVAAVEAEAQAVPPCVPAPAGSVRPRRVLPPAGKVTRFPRGELEGAGESERPHRRDRTARRQHRLLHLDRRQRDAERKAAIPNTVQTK